MRREQGALGRGRAPTLASGGRARAPAGRETWPLRGGPAPARRSRRARPMASLGYLGTRALWTARGPPEASGRTDAVAPARPALCVTARHFFSELLGGPGRSPPPAPAPRPLPGGGCAALPPRGCQAAHTRRYPGVLRQPAPLPPRRVARASDLELCSRFIY